MSGDAELLRRAAAKMRERAEAATAGPWEADGSEIYGPGYDDDGHRTWVGECCDVSKGNRTTANGLHIASWDPGVALAVANWLEWMAGDPGRIAARNGQPGPEAVARTYLGET